MGAAPKQAYHINYQPVHAPVYQIPFSAPAMQVAPAPTNVDVASDYVRQGREILRIEGQTLLNLANHLGEDFGRAIDLLANCRGGVIVVGMGKAGLVGQKIAATLASTGTRAHFVHPSEALHGDLGRLHRDDIVLALSYSGETEEVTRIIPSLRSIGATLIGITGSPQSTLGRSCRVVLDLGSIREACPLGLAPSASTTAMLALGDAIALVLSRKRQFSADDFARLHPGGALGRRLAKVEDVMRPLAECRLAEEGQSLREILVAQSRPGRRTGAIMVIDRQGKLTGIFTDSDLARLLESRRESSIDGPVSGVMTRSPRAVTAGTRLSSACDMIAQRKISELPVVDGEGRPIGLVDITDIVSIPTEEEAPEQRTEAPAQLKVVSPPNYTPVYYPAATAYTTVPVPAAHYAPSHYAPAHYAAPSGIPAAAHYYPAQFQGGTVPVTHYQPAHYQPPHYQAVYYPATTKRETVVERREEPRAAERDLYWVTDNHADSFWD